MADQEETAPQTAGEQENPQEPASTEQAAESQEEAAQPTEDAQAQQSDKAAVDADQPEGAAEDIGDEVKEVAAEHPPEQSTKEDAGEETEPTVTEAGDDKEQPSSEEKTEEPSSTEETKEEDGGEKKIEVQMPQVGGEEGGEASTEAEAGEEAKEETAEGEKAAEGAAEEAKQDATAEQKEESKEEVKEAVKEEEKKDEEKQAEVKEEEKEAPKEKKEDAQQEAVEVGTEKRSPRDTGEKEILVPTVNLEATATVKFVLMPSGQVVTLACTLGQTLHQLKEHFSSELKMSSNLLLLMFEGKNMPETTTLAELGVGPNGTVQLEMQSVDPVNTPIKTYRPRQEYHMPDVITVRVPTDDGATKDVVVEIERATRKKPFLGGFRHKKTGLEYHNASAQTMQKPRPQPTSTRYCRDTQTCEQRHARQQTTNDMSTQMTKIGVYVANTTDKLLIPGKYFTAEQHQDRILRSVIIMQKYYRRWLAKKYVDKLRQDRLARMEWERQEEIRKRREKELRIKREFERRMNPKSKEDFDLLYSALEKWRLEELERINATLTAAERKAALCMLLDQETQLLAAIDRHKLEANGENKQKRIQQFLEQAAAPKRWKGKDGGYTEMDTPYTIRAKELRDIYNSINMKYLTQDERLDVLLTLKHTVKEHDCKLTQEIIELIDREADLLMRGVKESNLEGLRKRISTLFLQYIKTPTFNPECTKLLKVPQDPSALRKNIYFCSGCNSYLPSTEFPLSSNSRVVGKCRKCAKIDNDARTRQDYSKYRHMLKHLRQAEEAYNDGSQIAFLLQDKDLRYLVENIWNAQSILSAWDDLYDLVFVRWDKHEEWSPWNCILLTKDEAAAHQRLETLDEGYGQVFIHKTKQKHTMARIYFSRLPGMAEYIRQQAGQRDLGSRGPSVSGRAVPVQH